MVYLSGAGLPRLCTVDHHIVDHRVRLHKNEEHSQIDMLVYLRRKKENVDIIELLGLETVSLVIRKGRLRWIGHSECKDKK